MFTNVVFVENLAQCRTQLWVLIAAHNSERTLPHSILYKYGLCWKCSSILPSYLTYLLACDLCHNKFTLKRFLKTHIQAIQASATKKCFFYSCCKKFTLDRFLKILSSHTGARRQFFVTFCDIHDLYTWPAYLPDLTSWPTFLTKQTFSLVQALTRAVSQFLQCLTKWRDPC